MILNDNDDNDIRQGGEAETSGEDSLGQAGVNILKIGDVHGGFASFL